MNEQSLLRMYPSGGGALGLVVACVLSAAILGGCGERSEPAAQDPVVTEAPADGGEEATTVDDSPAGFVRLPAPLAELDAVESQLCAIRVNGARPSGSPLRIEVGQTLEIKGWLGDESSGTWPERPFLLLERAATNGAVWRLDLGQPQERSDVARRLDKPGMRMSGFEIEAGVANIPAGNYRLHAAYESASGRVHVCRRGGALAISN